MLTLNLNLDTVDVSVTQNVQVLTANATGAQYQWLNCNANFTPISNATQQTFTASVNGSFAVQVTQNNCTDTSQCFVVDRVGIERFSAKQVLVFPNPNTGYFTLQLPQESNVLDVQIFDMSGKRLFVSQWQYVESVIIDIPVSAGIYMIHYQTEHFSGQKRLVIE